MTPTQKKVYDYIKSHIAEHGYSPTYRQMVVHLGYCLSNIHRIVHLLKEQGLISVSPERARSIQLVEDDRDKLIMRMSDALKMAIFEASSNALNGKFAPQEFEQLIRNLTPMQKVSDEADTHIRANELLKLCDDSAKT